VWGYFFQYWPLSLFFLIGGLKRRETNEKSSSKNREKKERMDSMNRGAGFWKTWRFKVIATNFMRPSFWHFSFSARFRFPRSSLLYFRFLYPPNDYCKP